MKIANFILVLKGIAIGIANIIPGVSGGTIALITGIYTDLLHSIKRLNLKAINFIIKLKFQDFVSYTNFKIILYCGSGIILGVILFAKLISEILKTNHGKLQLEGLFFGLILASIYYVGKRIKKWNMNNYIILFAGIIIAVFCSNININTEANTNYLYVFICGVISTCGMILPGLSGSYILILMGNYELLMIDSVNYTTVFIGELLNGNLNSYYIKYFYLLLIFIAGSVFGLISFANIVSWFYKKYTNSTLSILTGFIIGSLTIIWPWKKIILLKGSEKYNQFIPQTLSQENIITFLLILMGVLIIYYLEKIQISK